MCRSGIVLPHGECLVFGSFHDFTFARSLVIDAAQMQNAVYDNTVQLFVISASYLFGIAAHGIQTDEQVTADYVVFAIVERDDVGIIIVLLVFPVYFKNLFVIALDVGFFANLFAV